MVGADFVMASVREWINGKLLCFCLEFDEITILECFSFVLTFGC